MLAVNLRNLSQNLRKLELTETVIDWDFLFPLDDRDNPMALTSSLYWPYLEIVRLECVPQSLPSGRLPIQSSCILSGNGECLLLTQPGEWSCDFEPTAWVEATVPDPTTAGTEIFLTEFMERGTVFHAT
jgi:hypothetical protein